MYISSSTALSRLHSPSSPFPFYGESPLAAVASSFGFSIIRQRKKLNLLVLSMDRAIYVPTDFAISSNPRPCPRPALSPHSIPATSSYSPDPTLLSLYQTPAHAGSTTYRDAARARSAERSTWDEEVGGGVNAIMRKNTPVSP